MFRCAQLEIKDVLTLISVPSIDWIFPRSKMDQSQQTGFEHCIWVKIYMCTQCGKPLSIIEEVFMHSLFFVFAVFNVKYHFFIHQCLFNLLRSDDNSTPFTYNTAAMPMSLKFIPYNPAWIENRQCRGTSCGNITSLHFSVVWLEHCCLNQIAIQ